MEKNIPKMIEEAFDKKIKEIKNNINTINNIINNEISQLKENMKNNNSNIEEKISKMNKEIKNIELYKFYRNLYIKQKCSLRTLKIK